MSRWRSVGWVAAILGVGGLLNPPFPRGVLVAATMLAALVALTLVRELVRLAVGTASGLHPAIVELGEGRALLRFRTGALRWRIGQTPIVSATIWSPPPAGTPVRGRLAVLALVRPAATAAIVLGIRALRVPGLADAHGAPLFLASLRTIGEYLLLAGLLPFSLKGTAIVPFESDGLKLSHLLLPKGQSFDQDFARFYFASAREALDDQDPVRALAVCRAGLGLYGPPWLDVLRAMETAALSRTGDHRAALAQAEAALGRDLPPVARAVALNDWSWYAFLERNEANLRLADRRSADAMLLKGALAATAGTRGAVLLWRGRVSEALPLLARGHDGAHSRRAQDVNACLLAMAHAARGDVARAQAFLDAIKIPDNTEGLWPEALRWLRLARDAQPLPAARGGRALAVFADGVELRDSHGTPRRLTAADLGRVKVGVTARGRTYALVPLDGGVWRLPLRPEDLTWTRALLARAVPGLGEREPSVASVEGAASVATQERAYEERMQGLRAGVSTPKGIAFLGSLVAFGASMLMLSSSWKWLGMIVPILFVHELGHWLAMRSFGHRDASISFIPFLGAATMTRTPFDKRWQEVVMLLAGPVPGILIGVGLLLSPLRGRAAVHELAVLLISINAANLLPLHPLDGGRILHALVTAGRPVLDLVFKTGAALAFFAAGLAAHEPVLTFLGLFGVLFWGQARRVARLERRIRRTPGFDPRLPAKERRAYVFRALAQESPPDAKDWASTVAALEMPLGYRPTPGWQIGLGVLVVAVMAGGLTGVGLLRRQASKEPTPDLTCPEIASARPVSCAGAPAFEGIAWENPSASVPGLSNSTAGSVDAFVWCVSAAGAAEVADALVEAQRGARYCQALPWERSTAGSEDVRRKARWTMGRLREASDDRNELAAFDLRVADARAFPLFDAETARLLREIAVQGANPEMSSFEALADRLGRSPDRSCDRLRIRNVRQPGVRHAPKGAVSFSITMRDREAFSPLGTYLCQAGCTLSVLPAASGDRRTRYCW